MFMLDNEKIILLIAGIKKKKELQHITDDFAKEQLLAYLRQEHKLFRLLQENCNPKSKSYRVVIKQVRARLRKAYGLFRDDPAKRQKLMEKLLAAPAAAQKKVIDEILSTHASTKERLPIYNNLYAKIFALTGKPGVILDLGCGINPFSYPYMKLRKCTYLAYDINEEEINILNKYFSLLRRKIPYFDGQAAAADVLQMQKIPPADVCFLFKMTDVLDKNKGHKATEEMLKRIPAEYVVVSFATKTMSGKKMTAPRRNWMEWLCKRLRYEYTILEFPNELFYVVKK